MKADGRTERQIGVDLADLANDLMVDLGAAAGLCRGLLDAKKRGVMQYEQDYLNRIVLGTIVINLFKVEELLCNPSYAKVIGKWEKDWRGSLRARIKYRGLIDDLRNGYLGHIQPTSLGRPYYQSELATMMREALGHNFETMLQWCCDGERSVRAMLIRLRRMLIDRFNISEEDILNR